ncbi:two-partner secretion domain-containing protein [Desulforegula conservatrix]|uniref:two-partner secretion domain-containing protein n=1 Tax=Desulforegula conservatrix TaxID=153026 RepID=UPI000406CD00|nr:filamentous hemagglutinin N-terminal domain-containing protein [Desulforegula conservatrix]
MKKNNLFLIVPVFLLFTTSSFAEVKLDGSMGVTGSLPGPDFRIEATVGQKMGPNLFHSFEKFNIATGETATFAGPADISRIISRVTGGSVSNIDGLLASEIQGADFYLINPYGIVFGKNASLDISGSFFATTADHIKLGENGRFDAKNPSASILTSAPPEAFGFVGNSPGKIEVESSIDVGEGKYPGLYVNGNSSITIAGGDISFMGGVARTYKGPINIVSVASVGELNLDSMNTGLFSKLGNIDVRDFSVIFSFGGGNISVQSQNLNLIDGGEIYTKIFEDRADAGNLDVNVRDSILVSGQSMNGFLSYLGAEVQNAPNSRSGDVNISARYLRIDNGASVSSYSARSGPSGNVTINADRVETLGGSKISSEILGGIGKSGDIIINAYEFFNLSGITAEGVCSSVGTTVTDSYLAYGGDIRVFAPEILMDGGYLTSLSSVSGNSGNIAIETDNMTLINGGSVYSSISEGIGIAGNIDLKISNQLFMSGFNVNGTFTNINSAAVDSIYSAGGNIALSAGSAWLEKGAYITSSSVMSGSSGNIYMDVAKLDLVDGGRIFADIRQGQGRGGALEIIADEYINIAGAYAGAYSSRIASEAEDSGTSNGGSISLVSPLINIIDEGYISTVSNSGDGGSIDIGTWNLNLINGGSILASKIKGSGSGGNIFINAVNDVNISGKNESGSSGGINSSANGAPGAKSGDIAITAASLKLSDGGYVTSSAFGSGDSGSLFVDVDTLELLGGGRILSAIQGGTGIGGELSINARTSVLIQGSDVQGASSIISSAVGSFTADGGNLNIITDNLTIDGGFITSSSVEGGRAGNLAMNVGSLSVLNGGTVTSSVLRAVGRGGNVYIDARDYVLVSGVSEYEIYSNINSSGVDSPYSNAGDIFLSSPYLRLENGGFLSSSSTRSGDAGNINIWASDVYLVNSGHIDTASDVSAGGSMHIDSAHMINLENSYISSSVYGGTGNGGNMLIGNPEFIILDGSYIIAIAYEGNGGNIDLKAGLFIADPISKISASSQLGIDGIINIDVKRRALWHHFASALAPLPHELTKKSPSDCLSKICRL